MTKLRCQYILYVYRVDTLFIATPPDIYPYVGIGSGGASGVEQEQARTQMQGEQADLKSPGI